MQTVKLLKERDPKQIPAYTPDTRKFTDKHVNESLNYDIPIDNIENGIPDCSKRIFTRFE